MTEALEVKDVLLSDAYIKGRQAGHLHLAPSLNPFPEGAEEHHNWRLGWDSSTRESITKSMRDSNPDHWSNWETRGDGYGETNAAGMPFRGGQ